MSAPRLDLQPGLHDPVILMVSREAVESQDIASVLGRLRLLSATREDAWLYCEQLSIVYDGYENAPRELVDIEEVLDGRPKCGLMNFGHGPSPVAFAKQRLSYLDLIANPPMWIADAV